MDTSDTSSLQSFEILPDDPQIQDGGHVTSADAAVARFRMEAVIPDRQEEQDGLCQL